MNDTPPSYDAEEGRVILDRYLDGTIRAALEVRRGLEEEVTRDALIAELRLQGYTVLPPRPPGNGRVKS